MHDVSNIIKNLVPQDVLDLIKKQKYIGLRLSGGSDSAMLCYIFLRYFPEVKIVPITFYNKLRPCAEISVQNILNKLKEMFPDNNLMASEVGYFDTSGWVKFNPDGTKNTNPKDTLQRKFVLELTDKHQGDLCFILSGETMNPPVDDQKNMQMEQYFMKSRNLPTDSLLLTGVYNQITRYEFRPFRNFTKKQIAEFYKHFDLMDSLFSITETCESVTDQYKKYTQDYGISYSNPGVEPCQCCWPCREKYWAYGVFDFNTPRRVIY